MTHENFYKLLQKYERTDEFGYICIPEKYEITVAREILKYNKYRYFETEQDALMIWQNNVPYKVQNYIIKKCLNNSETEKERIDLAKKKINLKYGKGEKHERF